MIFIQLNPKLIVLLNIFNLDNPDLFRIYIECVCVSLNNLNFIT